MYLSINDISKSFTNAIKLLLQGEEIIITRNKKPIAKLITIKKDNDNTLKIKAGSAKGKIKIHDNFDDPLDDFNDYIP
ncbi:MAG: hypothetical protein A2033_08460 [Bacteroidetes bacterium GWA2_31_9]|nr:MAG: hypothetical protein A2033_08460 [Bacteroidetes bacterium GWA2_31_9]